MRKSTNVDRTVRDLALLYRSASTARVLNLLSASVLYRNETDYLERPFFTSPRLNESLILKHRIRSDEVRLLPTDRLTGTKVILPFERTDLKMGGRSFMVEQKRWRDVVDDICGAYRNPERDIHVLQSLNELPSLDPFLVREHLRRRGVDIAPCYFNISESDIAQMYSFVGKQIEILLDISHRNRVDGSSWSNRMIRMLLSPVQGESLQPIRSALRLDPDDFEEGIFAWKGFLYYQWVLSDLRPQLAPFLREILTMKLSSLRDREMERMLDAARRRLADRVNGVLEEVVGGIRVYEAAFNDLTRNGKPLAFSNFLQRTPEMFFLLGERIGALSHVASYWRFRFPEGVVEKVATEELIEIVRDFEYTLGREG